MSTFKFLLGFIASPALLLAQLNNNTVTATASQSIASAPDQATLSITVSSGATASLEQIVNALSGVGVTAANLNYVLSLGDFQLNFEWNFQLPAPIAQLETTTAKLTVLETSISQNNSGLSLSFYVSGTSTSAQASTNCNFSTLLSQARTQAQQIAGAAGLQTGAVTALSAASTACSLTATFAIPTLLAQPGPNTITTVASGGTPQNDQASIYVSIQSPLTAELSDITSALTAAGLPGASLTGVSTQTIYNESGTAAQNYLQWSYTLTVPLSKLTATLAQLASAQQTIGNGNSGLTLTFTNAQASASQSQQAAACSQATLVGGALALAQQITTAAGVSVGPIVNISQGSSGVAASFLLDFATNYDVLAPCALTLQYQLL
jgi:hypothetical protein